MTHLSIFKGTDLHSIQSNANKVLRIFTEPEEEVRLGNDKSEDEMFETSEGTLV